MKFLPVLLFALLLTFAVPIMAWDNADYRNRIQVNVTMQGYNPVNNVYNITLNTATLGQSCNIRMYNSTGSEISWQAENATSTAYGCNTTTTLLWASLYNIQPNNSTKIYVYYNTTNATQPVYSILNNDLIMHLVASQYSNSTKIFTDISGYGHNATAAGAVSRSGAETLYGQVFVGFTGEAANYANVTNTALINSIGRANTSYSISLWVKTLSSGAKRRFINKESATNFPFDLAQAADNRFHFDIYDGTNNPDVDSGITANDGAWHHVVGVVNATNKTIEIYVDGYRRATANAAASINMGTNNTDTLIIGKHRNDIQVFNGQLDDIRIYNRSLTGDDVINMYVDRMMFYNPSEPFSNPVTTPVIVIQQPTGTKYFSNSSLLYYVTGSFDKCQYEMDGTANVSLDGCINSSIIAANGNHAIKIWANDTSGLWYSNSTSFTVNTTVAVFIASPVTIQSSTNVSLNYYVEGFADKCYYELDSGANVSLASCGNTTFLLSESTHAIKVWANNTNGDWSSSSTTFIVDASAPVVSLIEPIGSYFTTNVSIRYNYTDTDGINICFYELDGAGNITISGCRNTTLIIANGAHVMKLFVLDNAAHVGNAINSFVVDTSVPIITITSPTGTYLTNTTYNTSFTYTAVSANGIVSCKYSLGGLPNVSITNCNNITRSIAIGSYTLRIYATDGLGTERYNDASFTIASASTAQITGAAAIILGLLAFIFALGILYLVVDGILTGNDTYSLSNMVVMAIIGIAFVVAIYSVVSGLI